MTDYFFFFTFS